MKLLVVGVVLASLQVSDGFMPGVGNRLVPRAAFRPSLREVSRGAGVGVPRFLQVKGLRLRRHAPAVHARLWEGPEGAADESAGIGPHPNQGSGGSQGEQASRESERGQVEPLNGMCYSPARIVRVFHAVTGVLWTALLRILARLRLAGALLGSRSVEKAQAVARWCIIAMTALFMAAPLPASAASICFPVPTSSGIGRACIEFGSQEPGVRPSPASTELTDYCQVDMLDMWYKCVNVGVNKSPGSPDL